MYFYQILSPSTPQLMTKILQAQTLSITLDKAQLPWGGAERPLDVTTIGKGFNELVEDFTRLGGAHTHQLRNELTGLDHEMNTVKGGDTGRMGDHALVLLNGANLNGDLLVQVKHILNRELLVSVPLLRSSRCRSRRASSLVIVPAIGLLRLLRLLSIMRGLEATACTCSIMMTISVIGATLLEAILRLEATRRLWLRMHLGRQGNRCLDGGNGLDSNGMTRQTLNLCLQSGIDRLQVGNTHGKIGDLGEKNGGIVNGSHILE